MVNTMTIAAKARKDFFVLDSWFLCTSTISAHRKKSDTTMSRGHHAGQQLLTFVPWAGTFFRFAIGVHWQ